MNIRADGILEACDTADNTRLLMISPSLILFELKGISQMRKKCV